MEKDYSGHSKHTHLLVINKSSLVTQTVKNLPVMQET